MPATARERCQAAPNGPLPRGIDASARDATRLLANRRAYTCRVRGRGTDTAEWSRLPDSGMREILDAVAAGALSPAEAEAELRGYATGEAGRFDAAREERSGVPEAILGDGKTAREVADLAETALETTGHVVVTRLRDDDVDPVRAHLSETHPDTSFQLEERAGVLVAHAGDYDRPSVEASVAVVSAGTADAVPAGEAAMVAREMGARVDRVRDVGVAAITRLTDRVEALRQHDVVVVAAGREGALPTVVAGLVDVPVIGLPVSTGYGQGGAGEAALLGMLQSCTALTVVNVDAGFTAGAQAGLIARQIAAGRDRDSGSDTAETRGDDAEIGGAEAADAASAAENDGSRNAER
jgi:NCAIR mutase (PurE)-related protein